MLQKTIARSAILILAAVALLADTSTVPDPDKSDLPYLLMADRLLPTDATEAQEETQNKGKKNEENTYWVPGEHANARTPLASPIFVIRQDSLALERLQIFPFEIRNGRRQVTFSRKAKTPAYSLTASKVKDTVFRMEVDQSLPPGEYAISPAGSNQVFAFAVY